METIGRHERLEKKRFLFSQVVFLLLIFLTWNSDDEFRLS